MHLIFRTLWILLVSRRRPKLGIWDSGSLPLRVQLTDIDIAMHVNNGMYLSLMDLGRFDLMIRSGIWRLMRQKRWSPVVNAETITFRKSLQLGQRYTIETKLIGFDERAIFFEQRMVHGDEIYARAYIATRLLSSKGPVSNEEIFEAFGPPPADLLLPDWIHDWRLNTALPSTRKPAPHVWTR